MTSLVDESRACVGLVAPVSSYGLWWWMAKGKATPWGSAWACRYVFTCCFPFLFAIM